MGAFGAPGRIRTCDLKIRNLLLYPTELRAREVAAVWRPGVCSGRGDQKADNGAGDGSRTRDPQLGRLMLYQLSYSRPDNVLVGTGGFEPPTPCSQSRCATRLRHVPAPGKYTARTWGSPRETPGVGIRAWRAKPCAPTPRDRA